MGSKSLLLVSQPQANFTDDLAANANGVIAELEGLLLDSPLVSDVAVIGVHSEEQHTELPRAYIVPVEGHKPSEKLGQEIVTWLDERVAYYKKLRGGVRFVDEIPKSQAGKILRRILKGLAEEEGKKEKRQAKL